MFKVIPDMLAIAAEEMQRQAHEMLAVMSEVENVEHALRSFSGYGDIITPLRAARDGIENEYQQLLQMSQALFKVRELYLRCETSLVDNAEGQRIINNRVGTSIRTTDLKQINRVSIIS